MIETVSNPLGREGRGGPPLSPTPLQLVADLAQEILAPGDPLHAI